MYATVCGEPVPGQNKKGTKDETTIVQKRKERSEKKKEEDDYRD